MLPEQELVEALARIDELEAQVAKLKEAAQSQRVNLNNNQCAPDMHQMLRSLHAEILEPPVGESDEYE